MHVVATPVAAAAATTIQIEKPTGGDLRIKHISVYTLKTLKFGHWDGHLYKRSGAAKGFKALFNKILPNTYLQGHLVFEGDVSWPHDWVMAITVMTQTADEHISISIEYELVPAKEPLRWW